MKTCFKCGISKPLSEFYRHKAMADGHLGKCKTCAKSDVAKHRAENIEGIREYDKFRANKPHRIESRARVTADYAAEHPKRRAANSAVARALRAGTLVKQPCFVCGEKAVAHHPDYDAPLSVVWLCQAHHKQAHALVKAAA